MTRYFSSLCVFIGVKSHSFKNQFNLTKACVSACGGYEQYPRPLL